MVSEKNQREQWACHHGSVTRKRVAHDARRLGHLGAHDISVTSGHFEKALRSRYIIRWWFKSTCRSKRNKEDDVADTGRGFHNPSVRSPCLQEYSYPYAVCASFGHKQYCCVVPTGKRTLQWPFGRDENTRHGSPGWRPAILPLRPGKFGVNSASKSGQCHMRSDGYRHGERSK